MSTISKTCKVCGINKPLSEFNKHKQMADGHLNNCKACRSKMRTAYYYNGGGKERQYRWCKENPEKVRVHKLRYIKENIYRERVRSRKRRRENPEEASAANRRWRRDNPHYMKDWLARHPEQAKAVTAVGHAIKSGRLTRSPCSICGEHKVDGHHHDYSKPLDVRWLCKKHHNETHQFENWLDYFIGEAA